MAKKDAKNVKYHKLSKIDEGYVDILDSDTSEKNISYLDPENKYSNDATCCPWSIFQPSAHSRALSSDTSERLIKTTENEKIPWKSIVLASILFIGGTAVILIASLLISGIVFTKYEKDSWMLLILGIIMFIPGSYYVKIAYCACRRYPGYSFRDIPEFD